MLKKIAPVFILTLTAMPAFAEWGDFKTLPFNGGGVTDTNANGSTDCGGDYTDGILTPGRSSGGWRETRFLPQGWTGSSWPNTAANKGIFTQLYDNLYDPSKPMDPTRRCPQSFNEYSYGHVHGVLNAKMATYKGKVYAVYDSVGGYYSQNGILLQEDPTEATANPARPWVIGEFTRNPRTYIQMSPARSLFSFQLDFDWDDDGVLDDYIDGCENFDGSGREDYPSIKDGKMNGYYKFDPKWRTHTGINHEKYFCAPPAFTEAHDPDIVIRSDPSLSTDPNAKAFIIWAERYVDGSSADMPNGWDPSHPKPEYPASGWDSFPFRKLGVHVEQFDANVLDGGRENTNPGWVPHTPLTAKNSSDTSEDGEAGLRVYAGLDAISPRITALRAGTAYVPVAVWGETDLNTSPSSNGTGAGEFGQDQQWSNVMNGTIELNAKKFSTGTTWGSSESVGYACNMQVVSSGRATGRKKVLSGTHDVEVWKNTDTGDEEAVAIASFYDNGSYPYTCTLRVKRRDNNGAWATLGGQLAAPAAIGTGATFPRLTVYKNTIFAVWSDTTGHVHASHYVPGTTALNGSWVSLDYNNGYQITAWNNPTESYANPLRARGPSITVTSATSVTNPSLDRAVVIRVAYQQNEPGAQFADSYPSNSAAEGVWGTVVTSCKAVWTGAGYQCASPPSNEARSQKRDTVAYASDFLNVYKPSYWGLGVAWGSRVIGDPGTLSSSSSFGAANPVNQHTGWAKDTWKTAACNSSSVCGLAEGTACTGIFPGTCSNSINAQTSSTDLINDGVTLTHDGQANSVHLGFVGPIGDHRENDRGFMVKENQPMLGSQNSIATGARHTVAVQGITNTVYTWGNNYYGALGNGTASGSSLVVQKTPVAVTIGVSSDPVVKVQASYYGSGALTKSGKLWLWGRNGYGEVCNGTISTSVNTPTEVAGGRVFLDFSMGAYHTIALANDGSVWTCGYNVYGQLGDNDPGVNKSSWVRVRIDPGNVNFTGGTLVVAGVYHSCVSQELEGLYCFGRNTEGQLGTGDNLPYAYAKQVFRPIANTRFRPAQLAAGYYHTAALEKDGYYTWGYNYQGQLGIGGTLPGTSQNKPQLAYAATVVLPGATLFAGQYNTYILKRDTGTLLATGSDTFGELGNDSLSAGSANFLTVNNPGWVDYVGVGAMGSHIYTVNSYYKSRGYTWWQCWGDGSYNKCGTGSTSSQFLPANAFRPNRFPCDASVTDFQVFPGMQNYTASAVGCIGSVTFPSRASLCKSGYGVIPGLRWQQTTDASVIAYPAVVAPVSHYWTDDSSVGWTGSGSGSCSAVIGGGNSCAANVPMHVCAAGNTDQYFGNKCTWVNCDSTTVDSTTNGYWGGCSVPNITVNGVTGPDPAYQKAGTLCQMTSMN